jgi:hypothetical protein
MLVQLLRASAALMPIGNEVAIDRRRSDKKKKEAGPSPGNRPVDDSPKTRDDNRKKQQIGVANPLLQAISSG